MMELSETIESPLPPAKARDALVLYFQKLNYKPMRPTFLNDIEMARGFAAPLTGLAVSPRGWKAVFEAHIEPSGDGSVVHTKWTITTLGQVCSWLDIKYWKAEVRGVRTLLKGRDPDEVGIERQHASTLLGTILLLIGSIVTFGALLATLLLLVGWILALAAAGGLIIIALLALRAPRDIGSEPEDGR